MICHGILFEHAAPFTCQSLEEFVNALSPIKPTGFSARHVQSIEEHHVLGQGFFMVRMAGSRWITYMTIRGPSAAYTVSSWLLLHKIGLLGTPVLGLS